MWLLIAESLVYAFSWATILWGIHNYGKCNKSGLWVQKKAFMHFLKPLSLVEFRIMGNINLACECWSLIYAFFHNHCHFKTYLRWFTSEAKLHNARDAVNRHSLSVHSHWKRHCQALFSYKCDTIHWLLPWQTILHGFLKRRRRRRKGGRGEELLMLTLSLNN